ncbi:MAG: AIPR family protein, partial [Bacteroidota bacterium]|nr:AIPR family protein [Bacteroidota bacterium]
DDKARVVFVIQGKYRLSASVPSEQRSDVIALAQLGCTIVDDDNAAFKALLNKADEKIRHELEEARVNIRKKGYRLNLKFVTTGKVSPVHREEAESIVDRLSNITYQCFSRIELLRLMQDYIEGAAPPVPNIQLPVRGKEVFKRYDSTTGITSLIFTMAAKEVGDIFSDIGVRLFARNIRGFLGNTSINKGMQTTLTEEPELFWYFNNGITIVCDEAKLVSKGAGDNLKVSNAQIINGQQTTRSLAIHTKTKAEVLVKLVEIPRSSSDGHNRYNHIVSEIVSATNWQNAISQPDLKANDGQQVRLERELRKHNYLYLRKRANKAEVKKNNSWYYEWIITKEDLAKAVGACVLDPYEVRLGKDRLFMDDVYGDIFNEDRPASEYLTFFWLNRLMRHHAIVDSRRGYARYLVLNFLWSKIGKQLRLIDNREKFRKVCERLKKSLRIIQPLDKMAELAFTASMAFYRKNKIIDGKVNDESSFFRHKKLHIEFEKFWNKLPAGKRKQFEKLTKEFFARLGAAEL